MTDLLANIELDNEGNIINDVQLDVGFENSNVKKRICISLNQLNNEQDVVLCKIIAAIHEVKNKIKKELDS